MGDKMRMKSLSLFFLLSLLLSFAHAEESISPYSYEADEALYAAKVSDAECMSKGYDCALKNKCVHDGSLRPFARLHPKYRTAIKDVRINPNHLLNWPQIFYICPVRD